MQVIDFVSVLNKDFYTGVPDSQLKALCNYLINNYGISDKHIITANEGNAVGLASGYYLATSKIPVVYMQNSGEGNIINPLASLLNDKVYAIPTIFIIGWRGEPGVHDEPQHVKQGKLTLPLLDTMGVKYQVLGDNYKEQIDEAYKYMRETNKPYALVVRKGTFTPYKMAKHNNDYPMTREESLKEILSSLNDDDFVVSTTGKTSREIFEIREQRKQGHGNDFLTVGSMGHTSSIALGMSLGTDKKVYCIDGDGSFIMHMGASAIVANNQKNNLRYILINNGAHESVGGQPTLALDIDCKKILEAVGFKKVYQAKSKNTLKKYLDVMKDEPKSALIVYVHQGSREDLGRPTKTPIENKEAIMQKLGE